MGEWWCVLARLTIGCSGCGAWHVFGRNESLARRPRTTDPCVVRPLGKYGGSRSIRPTLSSVLVGFHFPRIHVLTSCANHNYRLMYEITSTE
jgi:hypothetical protein